MSDPKLADRVADNLTKFGPTESESLYVVSITDGAIYRISRK